MNQVKFAGMTGWILLILSLPFFTWIYFGFTENLGAEPIVTLNDQSGYVTLILLVLNLWLGLFQKLIRKPIPLLKWLYKQRRRLGIATGVYAVLHFMTYLGKEGFETQGFEQIVTKTYLTVAFGAWLILMSLTVTSNDLSLRLLKVKKWKRLHRMVHVAFILVIFHVLLIEKADLPLLALILFPIVPFQIFRLWKSVKTVQTGPHD